MQLRIGDKCMKQLTFGDAEYLGKRKRSRHEIFLDEMHRVIPWDALLALIEPGFPDRRTLWPRCCGCI